jgi:hypothetical protein
VATWWWWRPVRPAAEGNQFPKKGTDRQPSRLKAENEKETGWTESYAGLFRISPVPVALFCRRFFREGWKFFCALRTFV